MRTIDTKAFLDTVCRMLHEGADTVPVPVTGTSMAPFLRPGDTAFLSLPDAPLSKGDIVLFLRPNGKYILHRIVKVNRDGSYLLLGDSQLVKEQVAPDWIRAKAVKVRRSGKVLGPGDREWQLFARGWVSLIPIRRQILGMRKLLKP